jgi:hypothetical protein
MANEGIDSPDREPQSPSRSISQKVSMADVLGQTVCRDSNNRQAGACPYRFAICYLLFAIAFEPLARMPPDWIELGRLRENNKVPERGDYSRRDQTAIDLNF